MPFGGLLSAGLTLAGGLMGGSQSGSTMSSAASFPSWLTPLLKDQFSGLLSGTQSLAQQPFQSYQGQQIAGFTPDQLQAFGINHGLVGQAQQGLGQANNTFNNVIGQGLNGINPSLIQSYMNPYTQNVINANQTQALQGYDLQKQQLQEQQGQTGAFGGSRSAIASQQLNKNFFNGLNAQNANLYSQGYGQALGAAQTGLKLSDIGASQLGQNSMLAQQAGMQQAGALQAQGGQQQGLAQQQLNIPYQNFLAEQEFPYQQQQYQLGNLGSIANIYKGGVSSQTNTGGPGPWGNALGMLQMQQGMGNNPFGSFGQSQSYSDGTNINWNGSGLLGGLQSFGSSIGNFFGFRDGGLVNGYASGGLVDPYGSGSAHTPYSGVLPTQEHSNGPYDLSGGPYGSSQSKVMPSPRPRGGKATRQGGLSKAPKVPLMSMAGLRGYQNGGMIPHGCYADGGEVNGGFFDNAQSQIEGGLNSFARNFTPYYNQDGSQASINDTAYGKLGQKMVQNPKLLGDVLLLAPELSVGARALYAGGKYGAEGLAKASEYIIDAAKNHPEIATKLARYAGLAAINSGDVDKGVANIKSKTPNYDAAHPDIQKQVNSIVNPSDDPVAAHDAAMMARTGGNPNTGPMYSLPSGQNSAGMELPMEDVTSQIAGLSPASINSTGRPNKKYTAYDTKPLNEFEIKEESDRNKAADNELSTQSNPKQGQVNLPLVAFGSALLNSRGNFFQSMGAAGQAWTAQKNAQDINAQREALLEQMQGTRQEKADAYAQQVQKSGMMNPLNQAYKMAQIQHLQAQGNNPYAQAYSKAFNTLMMNTPAAGSDPAVFQQVQQQAQMIAQQAMGGTGAGQSATAPMEQKMWDDLAP